MHLRDRNFWLDVKYDWNVYINFVDHVFEFGDSPTVTSHQIVITDDIPCCQVQIVQLKFTWIIFHLSDFVTVDTFAFLTLKIKPSRIFFSCIYFMEKNQWTLFLFTIKDILGFSLKTNKKKGEVYLESSF